MVYPVCMACWLLFLCAFSLYFIFHSTPFVSLFCTRGTSEKPWLSTLLASSLYLYVATAYDDRCSLDIKLPPASSICTLGRCSDEFLCIVTRRGVHNTSHETQRHIYRGISSASMCPPALYVLLFQLSSSNKHILVSPLSSG